MDWTNRIADLLAAGIGGLIGATLGAYLKGYSEEKGKHLATYEDIESLLAQERGKAYEQEKGKRLATHEDIEDVLTELRDVTKETETIKAQIGGDLWTRQMVWQQKREAYSNILKCSHEFQDRLVHLMSTRTLFSQVQQRSLPEGDLPSDLAARSQEVSEALRRFLDAVTEAQLFVDGIQQLRGEYVEYMERIKTGAANDQDKVMQNTIMLGKWTNDLIKMARQDLGVKPN